MKYSSKYIEYFKLYLNQDRRIWKYSRFQPLPLSLNVCWIKWRKFQVSMYVKNLHSPIINFYWIFYSIELLKLYFSTAKKIDSLKISLRDIFQAYLWCLRRFCKSSLVLKFWGTKLNLSLILYFCRSYYLITHYVFGTSSAKLRFYFLMRCSTDMETMYFKVKQLNFKILMQCSTEDLTG